MPFCIKCGKELEQNNKFCKYCGTPVKQNSSQKPLQTNISSPVMHTVNESDFGKTCNFCRKCGAKLKPGVKFCEKCGSSVIQAASNLQNKDSVLTTGRTQNEQNTMDTQSANNSHSAYFTPQSFPSDKSTGPNSVVNDQYIGNDSQSNKKSSNKAVIITSVLVPAVLMTAIICCIVFLAPMFNSEPQATNVDLGASSTATDAATSTTKQPEAETSTAEPATSTQQTEPQTEAPKVLINDKHYDQYVEVISNGSNATLVLYEWRSEGWTELMSANATVGKNGVGTNYGEGKNVTPEGVYNIGFCYGLSKPVTGLEFKKLYSNSIFVDDPLSPYYNCLVTTNEYSGSKYENTYNQFARNNTYSTNIFIEHNGDGETPNTARAYDGSVITICGYNGSLKPTLGCIDISSNDMTKLLAYLDSSKNPVIIIS